MGLRQEYQSREAVQEDSKSDYYNQIHRILSRQNLHDDACAWYSDLEHETKHSWESRKEAGS